MSFKVCGVATFLLDIDYSERFGYTKEIVTHPVLMYSAVPETQWESLYFKNDQDQMMVLYEYMIKKKYTIKEAQEKFPELFL